MEEDEEPLTPAQPSSPFWLQSSTRSSPLRNTFGFVFNTTFLVLLLSMSAIALLCIQSPSLLLFAQHVLRPGSVKRGWDSLNLLLVLFAVVCGFLGRKDDQDRSTIDDAHVQGSMDATTRSVESEQSGNWYNYGMRRSFRSYPDLRQEMLFQYDPRPRSYDDSYVVRGGSPRFFTSLEISRSQKVDDHQEKNDGFRVKKLPSEDSAPAIVPQEQPPPPTSDLPSEIQTKQEFPSVRRKSRRTRRSEPREAQSPPPARTTSPPPLPAVVQQALEEQSATSTPKKRGVMTKELISSIYHQNKRKKKQRRRSHENLEDFDQLSNPNPSFPAPSPPPPPPPPPPTIFHNIFSTKKGKSGKQIKQSSSAPPPPPPPPQRRRSIDRIILRSSSSVTSKAKANRTKLDLMEQIAGEGSESPLIRIPPPPPPPPFKFRSWKFAVEGDYVKIASSGGGESEIEESDTGTPVAAENTSSLLTCPSPDVNLKADDFIAMFRSKLKLEKMNSIKQKQEMGTGFSPLGPDSSPSPN